MSQSNEKSQPTAEDTAESRRRSGTRRIDVADSSEPLAVPPPPRLPSVSWPARTDQDHVPTQPEQAPPSTEALTLPAPPVSRTAADVVLPDDDDDDRDTIQSPAPQAD
jgi:hypothetical protein